jgi:hypothetical protein
MLWLAPFLSRALKAYPEAFQKRCQTCTAMASPVFLFAAICSLDPLRAVPTSLAWRAPSDVRLAVLRRADYDTDKDGPVQVCQF